MCHKNLRPPSSGWENKLHGKRIAVLQETEEKKLSSEKINVGSVIRIGFCGPEMGQTCQCNTTD